MREFLTASIALALLFALAACHGPEAGRPYGFARLNPFPSDGSPETTLGNPPEPAPAPAPKPSGWKDKVRKFKGKDRAQDPPRLLIRADFFHSWPDRFRLPSLRSAIRIAPLRCSIRALRRLAPPGTGHYSADNARLLISLHDPANIP